MHKTIEANQHFLVQHLYLSHTENPTHEHIQTFITSLYTFKQMYCHLFTVVAENLDTATLMLNVQIYMLGTERSLIVKPLFKQ